MAIDWWSLNGFAAWVFGWLHPDGSFMVVLLMKNLSKTPFYTCSFEILLRLNREVFLRPDLGCKYLI
ncbi:hypothetical protein JTE90_010380 [Oedothorax gibbosus]|uniref:Uncharacterized protein n=1 Tax=Oedothorax gibbosus TaxID=931172 RepID=A0AAV6VZJ5_9ARAC|nr:hypothetical protein JTE90_010379 [Oedothorax gibbosus]KAG8202009.1 hypothetical protein JTE90_010380 [Oedothorax gibbosus]